MCNRACKLNMPHTFTTHFGKRNFNTAFFTYYATEFHSFIFTTKTFIIFDRTENARTKQSIPFWFKSTIIDCLWLFHFTIRPRPYLFRRGQLNFNLIKRHCLASLTKNFHKFIHSPKTFWGVEVFIN